MNTKGNTQHFGFGRRRAYPTIHPMRSTWHLIMVVSLVVLLTAPGGCSAGPAPTQLTVVQWNLENVFDTSDDPRNEKDDEFTPYSWRRWTESLYRLKLQHLAAILGARDADICCLQEVENRRVVNDLVGVIRTETGRHFEYIVHRDSTDHRGIDVALLATVKPHRVRWMRPIDGQRDTLVVQFRPGGVPLTVIVNHWKSRWGGAAETAPLRMRQALAVRRRVDAILEEEPDAAVLVAGDFNDDVDDASLVEGLRATINRKVVVDAEDGRFLYNLHGELPEGERGTFYYRRRDVWNSFDSMSVSRSMLPDSDGAGGAAWQVVPDTYGVVRLPQLLTEAATPKSFRRFKNKETDRWEYRKGYSDHLPVRMTLRRRDVPETP